MKTKTLTVAVVGATGLVGSEMLKVLVQRHFPAGKVVPLASTRSKGTQVNFNGKLLQVEEATPEAFQGVQIALFAGGDKSSQMLARDLAKQGTVVIDNSSAFRLEPDVPLVIPEVNPEAIKSHRGIIANPNCSTIQMVLAMKPIYDAVGIEHVITSTYQSVSGTGKDAVVELEQQTADVLQGRKVNPKIYPHQIAFNCLPQGWTLDAASLYTEEEMKMVKETKKILNDTQIKVSVTTVRVPVPRGHGESVYLITGKKISRDQAIKLWQNFPGIKVMDEPENRKYPTPLDSVGSDLTYVGHIREDLDNEHGLFFWVVADNLRKGAATNAVQIAEKLLEFGML